MGAFSASELQGQAEKQGLVVLGKTTEGSAPSSAKAAGIPPSAPSGRARVTGEQEQARGESGPDARHTKLFLELQTVGTTEGAGRCSPDTAEAHLKDV